MFLNLQEPLWALKKYVFFSYSVEEKLDIRSSVIM